jgi:NAD+ kinase
MRQSAGCLTGSMRQPVSELGREADLIVAIGGDGTLLFAAQLALDAASPLVGRQPRASRLSRPTCLPDEMIGDIDAVLAGRYETDARELLAARLNMPTARRSIAAR